MLHDCYTVKIMTSKSTAACSRKALPESIAAIFEVAIYSFACQAGLRSHHKVRGDPIIEGVISFFGRLLLCSSPQTLNDFESISSSRLGDWRPGQTPTKEVLTLAASKLKNQKDRGAIRESDPPLVPDHLLHKEQWLTEDDRLHTRVRPKCWRCGTVCSFCQQKRQSFPNFGDFRVDTTLPFLQVLDKMIDDNQSSNIDDDKEEDDTATDMDSDSHYKRMFEVDFTDDDDEEEDPTFVTGEPEKKKRNTNSKKDSCDNSSNDEN